MSEEQWIELGKRLVACKHFRWMPGMRGVDVQNGGYARRHTDRPGVTPWHAFDYCVVEELIPDLRDPATLGCALALVREAWEGQFTVCGEAQLTPQALVNALEAADRIDAYNEPEHQAAEDLEYFRDNLFRSLKIPRQYLATAPEEAPLPDIADPATIDDSEVREALLDVISAVSSLRTAVTGLAKYTYHNEFNTIKPYLDRTRDALEAARTGGGKWL